jgi:predicted lipid-binding transport protein (Tim44 family)
MLEINKGIGKPVEFRGLKGTYLYLAAGIVVSSLILALILYGFFGLNTYLTTLLVMSYGGGGIWYCMRLSHKYGVSGLLKLEATRNQPKAILISSANSFRSLREIRRPKPRNGSAAAGR